MKINSYLLFALLVILFSYTLAVDVSKQETTTDKKAKEPADALKVEAKADEGKYGVNYGGGGGGSGWGGGGGGGGGCRHGCCYRGYGGSCNRCCTSPEEAKAFSEKQAQAKEAADTHNVEVKGAEGQYGVNYGGGGGGGGSGWGGGGGGGCLHGCCYRGYGGSCNRCCNSPEEAKAFSENQAQAKVAADTQNVEAKGDEGQYGVNYGGGGGNNGGGGSGWGGGGGGGGCRHGCCYRGYGGSCNRCCTSPEEAKAVAENKEAKGDHEGKYGVNYGGGGGNGGGGSGWGGGGGGGCRHGCCYRGYGGSCNKCCSSPEEAKAVAENQSRP
ncbi:hypothetical protein LXL04_038033 [Taraxacum kok-saghyz]